MKFSRYFLVVLLIGAVFFHLTGAFASPRIDPKEATTRLESGKAVLIDVREPGEWADGVVTGALLLPLSDLRGPRTLWTPALETHKDKELIIYCRSGNRSGIALKILEAEGFKGVNAGAFSTWKKSGAPVKTP